MTFEEEINASFSDAEKDMAVDYTLTNDPHTGVIRKSIGEGYAREPAYEGVDEIIIVSPVSQFQRAPDQLAREVVQIAVGPFAGKWVLTSVSVDLAHYALTCKASE